jgi:hypothetical protein
MQKILLNLTTFLILNIIGCAHAPKAEPKLTVHWDLIEQGLNNPYKACVDEADFKKIKEALIRCECSK